MCSPENPHRTFYCGEFSTPSKFTSNIIHSVMPIQKHLKFNGDAPGGLCLPKTPMLKTNLDWDCCLRQESSRAVRHSEKAAIYEAGILSCKSCEK